MLILAVVLVRADSSLIRWLVGMPLVAHLGYLAMTSLPIGTVPGRPEGGQERQNLDLRSRVVALLGEVRRAEEYAQRARVAGWPRSEVEEELQFARRRVMTAAAGVAKATGRPPNIDAGGDAGSERRSGGEDRSFFEVLEQSISGGRQTGGRTGISTQG